MSRGVSPVHRIALAIKVFVQAQRVFAVALVGVHRPEPATVWLVIPGAEVVEAQVAVPLLAAIEIIIRRAAAARTRHQQSVGVKRVGVREVGIRIGQETRAAVAIGAKVGDRC